MSDSDKPKDSASKEAESQDSTKARAQSNAQESTKPESAESTVAASSSDSNLSPLSNSGRNELSANQSGLINSQVVIISQDIMMQEAIGLMVDKKISSLLVHDAENIICGILTERDVVHKFTLLEIQDKLTRNVSTIMSRPVLFCRAQHLREDITNLHLKHKIRHFPVISGTSHHKDQVVGVVSITDLARSLLTETPLQASLQGSSVGSKSETKNLLQVGILASQKPIANMYRGILVGMNFDCKDIEDLYRHLKSPDLGKEVILLDLDGFSDQKLHDMIPPIVKSKAFVIITTSRPDLIPVFKKFLNKSKQEIIVKPLDLGYLSWVLTTKWLATKGDSF